MPFLAASYPPQTPSLQRTLCSAVPWSLLRPPRCLKTAPPALSPLLPPRPPPFWMISACCLETPVSRKQVSRMKLAALKKQKTVHILVKRCCTGTIFFSRNENPSSFQADSCTEFFFFLSVVFSVCRVVFLFYSHFLCPLQIQLC